MSADWLYIAVVAVFWGGYPLITRLSSINGPQASFLLASVSLAPIAAAMWWSGDTARPTSAQIWPILIGGLMQGIGLMAFVRVATSKLDASIAIPISDVSMLLVTTLGAIAFFAEAVTAQRVVGIALLVTGIVLLRPA